jgi:hypothetical protein
VARSKGKGVNHRGDDGDARKADAFGQCTPSSPQQVAPQYAVTDGRLAVGTVEVIDGRFVAFGLDGNIIGRFRELKPAVRALPQARAT